MSLTDRMYALKDDYYDKDKDDVSSFRTKLDRILNSSGDFYDDVHFKDDYENINKIFEKYREYKDYNFPDDLKQFKKEGVLYTINEIKKIKRKLKNVNYGPEIENSESYSPINSPMHSPRRSTRHSLRHSRRHSSRHSGGTKRKTRRRFSKKRRSSKKKGRK